MLIQNSDNYWGGLCYDCKHKKNYVHATRECDCPKWGHVKGVGACKYYEYCEVLSPCMNCPLKAECSYISKVKDYIRSCKLRDEYMKGGHECL